jgi:methylenetetrahydrofolate dehydrogenase (NADP+)/methenyltetrahydrofolate cyclohydrolase
MIYDGKKESGHLQTLLKKEIEQLPRPPRCAILSVTQSPATASFIAIKKRYAEALGVKLSIFSFPEDFNEKDFIKELESIISLRTNDGIIIQLPLPKTYNEQDILNRIPANCDIDVLGEASFKSYTERGSPLPPTVGAISHILRHRLHPHSHKKANVVIVGFGRLVGLPIAIWLTHQGLSPTIVDIHTPEHLRLQYLKEADIVITGTGSPKIIKAHHIKENSVVIDAGTSEQAGILSGDCDPLCADYAALFTPVPGGVGPLTVAYLFKNLIMAAKRNM